jgi:hypothetical protein
MKKYFSLLVALTLSAWQLAPQGLSAQLQRRTVAPRKEAPRVNGVPIHIHQSKVRSGARIEAEPDLSFDHVQCWYGSGTDSTLLVIQFNDTLTYSAGGTLVWGYRYTPSGNGKTVFQMMQEVAGLDNRLTFLVQDDGVALDSLYHPTDSVAWSVGGIGFNQCGGKDTCMRVGLAFNLSGAAADTTNIKFHYTGDPNYAYGQTSVPGDDAAALVSAAIEEGAESGVIYHPFNYTDYGYPAYDFDYWYKTSSDDCQRWQSGWYNGYWSFFTAPAYPFSFGYAPVGVSLQKLINGGAVAFYYCGDMTTYCDKATISGPYEYQCPCERNGNAKNVQTKKK